MTATIDIALELADLPHVPVTALEPFQGNLKELSDREYHKLKKSLEENGVIVPFFVWQETGKLLDGHQRQRVFMREGWHVDVPVVYISAGDVQDAKRKLLVISSQYGKITQEGWDEFTFDLDEDWLTETAHFDALPFVFSDFRPTDPANDPHAEWEGMPEFKNHPKAVRTLYIHFKNSNDIIDFSELINQTITDKTKSIWFPSRPNNLHENRELLWE